ncbi:MAG TPA: S4 domain-containing protein, partial [Bacteroidales bacterium]|nr:S4 domain-containing protein [Bacteroidales bacterium]
VFEGVPTCQISLSELESEIPILEFLADKTNIFSSRGEARRMIKDGGVLINKEKANDQMMINTGYLLNKRYVLVQKGKKNYFLVIAG